VRIVKTTPPERGSRRRVCRSDRKWWFAIAMDLEAVFHEISGESSEPMEYDQGRLESTWIK
jgi:hypothetical protein